MGGKDIIYTIHLIKMRIIHFSLRYPGMQILQTVWLFAIPTTFILLLLLNLVRDPQREARQLYPTLFRLKTLSFGYGDGTGMSKGNLSREGIAHKGSLPQSELHDAEIATKTQISKTSASTDITESSNIVARREISSSEKQLLRTLERVHVMLVHLTEKLGYRTWHSWQWTGKRRRFW
jgi:hypothetical protein